MATALATDEAHVFSIENEEVQLMESTQPPDNDSTQYAVTEEFTFEGEDEHIGLQAFSVPLMINIGIAVFATVVNSLIIYVIARYRQLRSARHLLMINICVADIMYSMSGILTFAVITEKYIFGEAFYLCALSLNNIVFCSMASEATLLAITLERFIAIRFAYWYAANFTKRLTKIIIAGIWVFLLAHSALSVFVFNQKDTWSLDPVDKRVCRFVAVYNYTLYTYATAIPLQILPGFIMIGVYSYIWWVVRQAAKKDRVLAKSLGTSPGPSVDRKEVRAAKRFAMIVGLYCVCVIPFTVENLLHEWTGYYCFGCRRFLVNVRIFHPTLNPFFFIVGNRVVATAVKKTIRCQKVTPQDLIESN